ncbi:hypothetical protein ABH926_009737 [Catenulispora sp. GP43]|uniref:hypothetical protein n=1 Tax=Catenulispora sp. GP43 TaxID=3156263 RepID=UPI00351870F7
MRLGTRSGLRWYAAAVAVVVVALGTTTYLGTAAAADAIGHAGTTAEPLAVAAENVYRALSDADATAAMVFLSGSQVQASGVQRYDQDIREVSSGLAAIGGQAGASQATATSAEAPPAGASQSSGASPSNTPPTLRSAVSRLLADVPVYTGLVGTAQADARQDLPVGAAYLREASALMRTDLLPGAQTVHRIEDDRLAADAAAVRGPETVLAVAAVTFAVLVPAQLFVARRTRRRFNLGLVATTVLVGIVTIWATAVSTAATSATAAARTHRQSANALVTTDLAVLQAHGDELLSLAARGEDVGSYEGDYQTVGARLGSLLAADQGPGITDATAGYRDWKAAHGALAQAASSPQADNTANVRALAQATGAQPGTGTLFMRVDGDVQGAIAVQEADYRAAIDTAGSDLRGLATGTAALIVVAFATGAFGMDQRLREYR